MKLFMALFLLLMAAASLWAAPAEISYQGLLTDASGDPVADGSYSVTFTIYDAATGGSSKWSEIQSVATTAGIFSVQLGAQTPLSDSVFSDSPRFLGIAVGADPEIMPRTMLVAVPWAFRTATVDGAEGGALSGDLEISGQASIGQGHGTSGNAAFVAGENNNAAGFRSVVGGGSGNDALGGNSVVGGGSGNDASGSRSTVGGGHGNTASGDSSVVAGGSRNTASGNHATIAGGQYNEAAGDYSFTAGYADSISSDANHSVLFGIDSDLTQDSTFMVDMPHVRIGNEATGYELPTADGSAGQVLGTDGSGQAGWVNGGGGGGSTFIRWGNSTAPAGASLIYSGFGYAGHYQQTGPVDPIVVQGGDPGDTNAGNRALFALRTDSGLPPCIPEESFVPAAVCYSSTTALTIWGTHTAPAGWDVLYTGYALGSHYTLDNPSGPLCVDCGDFEFVSAPGIGYALLYALQIYHYATGDSDLQDKFIKCAVIKKQ